MPKQEIFTIGHSTKSKEITGFLMIDKEGGITSHWVVEKLRQITKIKKIGHAGTLDPLATGLLIIGIGKEATKKLSNFLKLDKEYLAKIQLGAVSDTYDAEGEIKELPVAKHPTKEKIIRVLNEFVGETKQIPPSFSAKKIKGKKAYELARKGVKIKLKPVKVKIYKISLLKYTWPELTIEVSCSSGTYIRSLVHNIGEKLGCGGYLKELKRTRIGNLTVKEAKKLSEITPENIERNLKSLNIINGSKN